MTEYLKNYSKKGKWTKHKLYRSDIWVFTVPANLRICTAKLVEHDAKPFRSSRVIWLEKHRNGAVCEIVQNIGGRDQRVSSLGDDIARARKLMTKLNERNEDYFEIIAHEQVELSLHSPRYWLEYSMFFGVGEANKPCVGPRPEWPWYDKNMKGEWESFGHI